MPIREENFYHLTARQVTLKREKYFVEEAKFTRLLRNIELV